MIKKTFSFLRFPSAFLAVLFFNLGLAGAENIPEESLIVDYTNCMTGCMEYEGKLGCEILCGCTMERFEEALNKEQYIALYDQISQDEVSPENRAFLDETANMCVAEMDRILAEFNLATPPEEISEPPEDEGGGE